MASPNHIDPLLDEARWKLGLGTPGDAPRLPVGRGAKIMLLGALFTACFGALSRALPDDEFRCSGQLADSDYFGPQAAFDGDRSTFFSLPDNTSGELEARFAQPRFATALIFHQPEDRRGFRTLTLAVNGTEVSPPLSARGPTLRWELPEPMAVHRLRIHIARWRGQSGAIAEVEFATDRVSAEESAEALRGPS